METNSYHEATKRLFWSQRPKGHLRCISWPLGGREVPTRWFATDAGVLLEAKPRAAPVETTRTPRVRVVATTGGGGFGKQRLLFATKCTSYDALTKSHVLTPSGNAQVEAPSWQRLHRCPMRWP